METPLRVRKIIRIQHIIAHIQAVIRPHSELRLTRTPENAPKSPIAFWLVRCGGLSDKPERLPLVFPVEGNGPFETFQGEGGWNIPLVYGIDDIRGQEGQLDEVGDIALRDLFLFGKRGHGEPLADEHIMQVQRLLQRVVNGDDGQNE